LRYFNAAGATNEQGEDHRPESHLIPLILQVASGKREFISILARTTPRPTALASATIFTSAI
jgi:UDP-glucose 4-epimerase